MGLLMCLAIGYEVSGIWFHVSLIPFVTRHMGVGTLVGHRPEDHGGSWDIRMSLDCL